MVLAVFEKDDLLLETLEELVQRERIDTAAITGGIGSLLSLNIHAFAAFAVPPIEKHLSFEGALEVGSIQGSVIGGKVHAHITAFHWDTQATYVGHLDAGSRVAYLVELGLVVLEGVAAERYVDERGNFRVRALQALPATASLPATA